MHLFPTDTVPLLDLHPLPDVRLPYYRSVLRPLRGRIRPLQSSSFSKLSSLAPTSPAQNLLACLLGPTVAAVWWLSD